MEQEISSLPQISIVFFKTNTMFSQQGAATATTINFFQF
jgi:hypothetical protein